MSNFNFEKAFKFPFADPRLVHKLGVFFGAFAIVGLISTIAQVVPGISNSLADNSMIYEDSAAYLLTTMVPILIALGVSLLLIPVYIYFGGYSLELTRNVMNGEENPLPEHNDIGAKMKLGFVYMGISLVYGLIITPIILIPIGIMVFVAIMMERNGTDFSAEIGILAVIAIILFILFIFVIAIFVGALAMPASIYLYLVKVSFGAAFSLSDITEVVRKGFGRLLVILGVNFGLGMALGILSGISGLCFMSWIVQPLTTIYTTTTTSHLTGQVYAQLRAEGVGVSGAEKLA